MSIDIDKAVGAELEETTFSWTEEDVILYNLAVGAGSPPDDPSELRYAYEADLQAVPAYGTIPPFPMMMSVGTIPGIEIELVDVLHGDQRLTLHRPIPGSGTVRQTGRVVDVYDKGKGALIVLEVVSTPAGSDEPLFTNRSGIYVRGEGGFGGDPGPSASNQAPDRAPDLVVESPTLPQQALLYRMASGDKNPLHADPAFAAFGGFEGPIIHGLCTVCLEYYYTGTDARGGEAELVADYVARFSGHVFPGETLVTSVWDEGGRLLVAARTAERGVPVLSNSAVTVRR